MEKKLILLPGLLLILQFSLAQDTLHLTLQDAVHAAITNNREVTMATLDHESAVMKFKQTNAAFLPQITLSYAAMVSDNPLQAFGFKLQQQAVTPPDFNPQLLNHPSTAENYMTRIELNQPIINMDMLHQRRAAHQQLQIYKNTIARTQEYLTFEMQKAYAQLQLSYQSVGVLDEAVHTAKVALETTQHYFQKGYLQKSDVLLVQVQVASMENQLAVAKSNVSNASEYIGLLMGVEGGLIYTVDNPEKINLAENPQTDVPEDRTDFKALKSALRAQEIMIHSTRMSNLPRLNAFANYAFNDKTALGFGSNSYLIGAQFSWTVFNGTASHFKTAEQKTAYAKIQEQLRYQREKSQLELNKTLRQLQDTRVAIQQHEISVTQAAEALRIIQNRFQQGLVSTQDLLKAQSTLSEEKLLHSAALFNYTTALAYSKFLTSIAPN